MSGSANVVDTLLDCGVLGPLDARLADTLVGLAQHTPEERRLVALAIALTSRAVTHGHVCVDLERLAAEPLTDGDGEAVAWPLEISAAAWRDALTASELVSSGDRRTPLVLEGNTLYLFRHYAYERRLAELLMQRQRATEVDEEVASNGLARLFGDADGDQRRAARRALERSLAVISGGPGTGKTTTVAKILALLLEQAFARGRTLDIALVAPTGKAAQRMAESLARSAAQLQTSDEVKAALPREASTIHRALGYLPGTPTRFRHHRGNPLSVDVVLADEASMIDLALMTKLVDAVPDSARLILLGDKDQLASVEAGAVLADLWDAPALEPCTSRLSKSYRFGEDSGIAALARAVARGDAVGALEVLRGESTMPYGEVALQPPLTMLGEGGHDRLPEPLGKIVTGGLAPLFESVEPRERLKRLNRFRILCAHRRGIGGVQMVNVAVERHLRWAGHIRERSTFYDGRPIMITANDHQLGLFNGDVGVVCRQGAHGGRGRRVFFDGPHGPRAIPIGRLPQHETVFAMTVHKSQGSEVDRVAIVLPTRPSPILTRELIYTAVTRARTQVDLFGSAEVLRLGVERRIERASGLARRLGGTETG